MSIWREGGAALNFARKMPSWVKRPARRLLQLVDRISKRLGFTIAAGLDFPTAGIVSGRENIVLIVHEATRTGAPILAWNLVRELQKKYNTVVLLKRGGSIQAAFEAIAAAVICLPDHFPMRAAEVEIIARRIHDVYAPQFAIANSAESRYFVPELEALSIPVVALIHEFSSSYRPLGVLYGLFSTASSIVFPAQIVADAAVADYKILEAREFKILSQGQSKLPLIMKADQGEAGPCDLKKSWPGGFEENFCVVGIGTITMRKGVEFFIAVAAAVTKMLPSHKLSFAWVGTHYAFDQPYFDLLTEQVDRSGLNGRFKFLGELEDLEAVYDRADILFLASRLDPLPNVAIDATLHGIPVVCFDQASGMAEILSEYNETRALVVPYLDVGAAAELICNLVNDPVRLSDLSAAVTEVARQRFDMHSYVQKIDELGLRAVRALSQVKVDLQTISQSGAFNPELNLGFEADTLRGEDGILRYLSGSRLVAPWSKLRAGLLIRRPLEGFNPLIYATENPKFDPQQLEDPFAHYVRTGRPPGRWAHRVMTPSINGVSDVGSKKIAVHGHFHYPELLQDFLSRLTMNKNGFDLFLTTTSQAKAEELARITSEFTLTKVKILVGKNRGRDLAPFLQGLHDGLYSGYDIVGHFHSKRSPHVNKAIGERWREFIWEHLLGGEFAIADSIVDLFAMDARVGLVFPEDPHLNGWDENLELADDLAIRMKIARPLPLHFDFPIGAMFWARPYALAPLTRLNLRSEEFPAEPLPIDGTLLHALERLIPFAAADAGFSYATTYVRNSKR